MSPACQALRACSVVSVIMPDMNDTFIVILEQANGGVGWREEAVRSGRWGCQDRRSEGFGTGAGLLQTQGGANGVQGSRGQPVYDSKHADASF